MPSITGRPGIHETLSQNRKTKENGDNVAIAERGGELAKNTFEEVLLELKLNDVYPVRSKPPRVVLTTPEPGYGDSRCRGPGVTVVACLEEWKESSVLHVGKEEVEQSLMWESLVFSTTWSSWD